MSYFTKIRSHRYFSYGLIAAILIIYIFATKLIDWLNTESTDNAYIEADISNVSSEVNGVLIDLVIEENSRVTKDQIIARIKNDDYQAKVDKTAAVLEGAQSDIDLIQQDIILAEIDRTRAQKVFEFAQADFSFNQSDYDRTKKLSKDNYASQQKLDNTELAFKKSANELSQADLDKQTAEAKLGQLKTKYLAAKAKYAIAEQENVLALRDLHNTVLRSPINGIIGNSSLRLGNYIRSGVTLFSIVPDKLYVKANFKETQIAKFKNNMSAKLVFDSEDNYEVVGHIRSIAPATGSKFSLLPAANATGNFTKIVQRVPVTIDFEIPPELIGKLAPGMSTIVDIRTDQTN